MKRSLIAVLLLGGLLACGRPDPQELARWRGGSLMLADLDAHLLEVGSAAGEIVGDKEQDALERELKRLFSRRILVNATSLEKLRRDPSFTASVEAEKKSQLARRYLEKRNASFEVTVEEARAHFDKVQDSLRQEERRTFRHLYFEIGPGKADSCALADEIRRKVLAGASFEDLIRRHSESTDAPLGGQVGPVKRGDLRGELAKLIFALGPGEVSAVIGKGAACHLFQVVQVLPAVEPQFELLASQMASILARDRRLAWRRQQLEEALSQRQLVVPGWILGQEAPPADLKADSLILEIEGDPLYLRDLLPFDPSEGLVGAVQQWLGIRIFSALAAAELPPEELGLITSRIEQNLAFNTERRRAIENELGSRGEDFWRAYFARAKHYVKSPEVEASIYSWPLREQDVLGSMARPRAFRAALETGAAPATVFAGYAKDAGVRLEKIPQKDLRALAASRPDLAPALASPPQEGALVGPYRVANRLYVVRFDIVIPERELSFLEARPQLLREYLAENGPEVEAEWLDKLAKEWELVIHAENLQRFGGLLAERIRSTGANAAP